MILKTLLSSAALLLLVTSISDAQEYEQEFSRSEIYFNNVIKPQLEDDEAAAPRRDFVFGEDDDDGWVYGCDFSHHNGNLDWRVLAAHCQYAFIKATQGTSFIDRRFRTNLRSARENSIPVGAYHFLSSLTSGADQAAHFLEVYEGLYEAGDMPPVLDLEWDGHPTDRWASKTGDQIVKEATDWLEAVEAALGVRPIIYTNLSWWNNRLGTTGNSLQGYRLWMSRYGRFNDDAPPLPAGFDWAFWQFTDRGRAGSHHPIDVNVRAFDFVTAPRECVPVNSSNLLNDERETLISLLSNEMQGLNSETEAYLRDLISHADPHKVRNLITGQLSASLNTAERRQVFNQLRTLRGAGFDNGDVALLDDVIDSLQPDAVRWCVLQ